MWNMRSAGATGRTVGAAQAGEGRWPRIYARRRGGMRWAARCGHVL